MRLIRRRGREEWPPYEHFNEMERTTWMEFSLYFEEKLVVKENHVENSLKLQPLPEVFDQPRT